MARKMVLVPASMMEGLKNDDLMDLLGMIPKNYQSKARILLTALDGKVKLDEQNRVLYDDSLGSHIVDLVRYYVTPPHISGSRPADALRFGEFLSNCGVPRSALAKPIEGIKTTPVWSKWT